MELRYYFIFAVAIIALQLFLFNFSKTMAWLFSLSPKAYKKLSICSYLGINSLFVIHLTKIYPIYRIMALILALLLFSLFVSIVVAIIYRLSKGNKYINHYLKIAYPIAFFSLVGLSVYNAYTPKIIHYQIQLDKPLAQPLRIGVASDLHLGEWFGNKELDKLADIFNQQKVDLILLPGDIMDDNVEAYLAKNMAVHLTKLQAPLGVYATLGNHDFFGFQFEIMQQLEKAGINVLWDETVEINGQFSLIGRNDDLDKNRLTTEQLLTNVNTQKPVFLIDHRPTEIKKHADLPIDIQVSGHTHRGQIFPANLITQAMYHLNYGYEKIGLGHYFVTSGYGFWGIPMRLGTQSEVFIIDVKGQNN